MMRTKTLCLLIFFTSFLSVANQIKRKEIDKLLTQYHQLEQFNGVALVSHKGKVLFNKGYGKANFEWALIILLMVNSKSPQLLSNLQPC